MREISYSMLPKSYKCIQKTLELKFNTAFNTIKMRNK